MGSSVVVIGGGAAGALAALAARRAGADVTLVRRAAGASALSSGAFDFGHFVPHDGRALGPDDSADALARTLPLHPYAILGDALRSHLERARAFLVDSLEALAVRGAATPGENLRLATPLGTVKRAALAQGSIARGDLAQLPSGARLGVVGLEDHGAFDPFLVVEGLRREGFDAVPISIALGVDPLATMAEVARRLDTAAFREPFVTKAAAAAREAGATHLLLPTAGLVDPSGVCEELVSLGVSGAAELLGVPPSVPGLRLDRALEARLLGARVATVLAAVRGADVRDGRVRRVNLDDGRELQADSWVLATGRFLGGGIRHDGAFRETVFGLPVFVDGHALGEAWIGDVLDRNPAAPQPALRAGLRVDARMRPVDDGGRVPLANVHAAGAVIGGYDPAKDWSGLGVAALTALVAAQAAAGAA